MTLPCRFVVNGREVALEIQPTDRLIDLLRGPLGLLGAHEACEGGECGACTVDVDGRAVCACLYPAPEIDGRRVTTIEGLVGAGGELHALQRALVEHGAIQCGFCTPGMILSAYSLLSANPSPTEAEIREALGGNLCRCTGYVQIVRAIQSVAGRVPE